MRRRPVHHARSLGVARRSKLIKRLWRVFGRSTETQRVKVELDILRRDPVEGPFNEHHRNHTLLDDNPCSG